MKISNLHDINPKDITNIVFDWGGVITEIDFGRAIEGFGKLGYNGFTWKSGNYPHIAIMEKFEVGKAGPDEILHFLKQQMNTGVSSDDIWQAWNSLLLDTQPEHIEILKSLSRHFHISLLSNTNETHVTYYREFLERKFSFDFFTLFEHIFLSYEMGMRKPNREIFEAVLQESGYNASRTLFIDDLESNIETADGCGLLALHFPRNGSLKSLFEPWHV